MECIRTYVHGEFLPRYKGAATAAVVAAAAATATAEAFAQQLLFLSICARRVASSLASIASENEIYSSPDLKERKCIFRKGLYIHL